MNMGFVRDMTDLIQEPRETRRKTNDIVFAKWMSSLNSMQWCYNLIWTSIKFHFIKFILSRKNSQTGKFVDNIMILVERAHYISKNMIKPKVKQID